MMPYSTNSMEHRSSTQVKSRSCS